MILEGIVTTINDDGVTNISPMGPIVDAALSTFQLRPFPTSTTYQNMKRTGEAVFHVTDDVELIAQAAVGSPDPAPAWIPAKCITGRILVDACRWYALRVLTFNDRHERAEIACDVVDQGRFRDFFGFNRAKHAVLEAAILATRIHLLPADEVQSELGRLALLVEKTAGDAERRAFCFLEDYLGRHLKAEE